MEKESLIEQLRRKNPEIALYTVEEETFSSYGRVLHFDTVPFREKARKLSIPKNGQEYIYGKRDYFSVVLAFRYMLPHADFLTFKSQLSKLLDKAIQQNSKISMPELLRMMGIPANWKKITAYKKI